MYSHQIDIQWHLNYLMFIPASHPGMVEFNSQLTHYTAERMSSSSSHSGNAHKFRNVAYQIRRSYLHKCTYVRVIFTCTYVRNFYITYTIVCMCCLCIVGWCIGLIIHTYMYTIHVFYTDYRYCMAYFTHIDADVWKNYTDISPLLLLSKIFLLAFQLKKKQK